MPTRPPILWRDHPDETVPAALLLPGMGIRAQYYRPFADQLARHGFHTATLELRGQGPAGPAPRRAVDHGLYELAVLDLPPAIDAIRARHPRSPIVLIGHSLGGHIATLYALTTTTEAIAGIVTIAADSPYHRAHGACGLLVLATTQLAAGIARLLGYFPGDRLGGVGSQPRTLMVEWARLARSGRYQIREMPGIETQTVDAHLAVLAISIDGDRIAPPPSVDHLTSKLSNVQTKRWHYSCRAAGAERLTHVNWVTRGGGIAERIAAWHHTTAAAHISNPAAMEAVRGRRHAVAALPVDEISARKE